MKIKQADIARELGISKATVSLVLNGKDGVNARTRQKVLDKVEELRQRAADEAARQEMSIAILVVNHHKDIFYDPQMDLLTPVLEVIRQGCRDMGYQFKTIYLNDQEHEKNDIIQQCNGEDVAGVILMGTEMEETDHWLCEQIHRPFLLWDYDIPDRFLNSVCIDNTAAVEMGCQLLWDAGCRNIVYLALDKHIYNFDQRRKAFHDAMMKRGKDVNLDDIVYTGKTIEQITASVQTYLTGKGMPDAFLMENFEVSIGAVRAIRHRGIHVPEELKLVGIDMVPEGSTGDLTLTQIGIQHAERASLAMHMLAELIKSENKSRGRLLGIPFIISGNSV